MTERTRSVGLDVNEATIAAAVAEDTGAPEHGTIADDRSSARKLIRQLGGPGIHVRWLKKLDQPGMPCIVNSL